MLPSIANICFEKQDHGESPSFIEVDHLYTRWRKIKSQLLYADLFEGSLINRLKIWHQLQKACLFEKKNYQSHNHYKVPSHILKKDLMELFNVPSKNIVVANDSFYKTTLQSPVAKLDDEERSSLRQQWNVGHDDILIYLADEPNLQNGLYQALSTMKYFKEQKVAHLKLLLSQSKTTQIINRQIKELGISPMIVLANAEESQTELLSACDIVFLPALYAPHCLSLMRAMACERPLVLSSEVGGLETYLDLLSPYVFAKGSQPLQIANCLLPLIRSQSLRQQVGEKNAQAIEKKRREPSVCDLGQRAVGRVDPPKA